MDDCNRGYYWRVDPETGMCSESTWTTPLELWQQELRKRAEAEAAATLAAAAGVAMQIEQKTAQEVAYRKKHAYERMQEEKADW